MSRSTTFGNQLLACVPHLRAFAFTLCKNRDKAEDLVQDVLLVAWERQEQLREAGSLKPWLFAIMRNSFFRNCRKGRLEIEDPDGLLSAEIGVEGGQEGNIDVCDALALLSRLPADQREIMVLICVEQLSYEEASMICKAPVGTLKSRLNRARANLAREMGLADDSSAEQIELLHENGRAPNVRPFNFSRTPSTAYARQLQDAACKRPNGNQRYRATQ